jgi:hypothetical protein
LPSQFQCGTLGGDEIQRAGAAAGAEWISIGERKRFDPLLLQLAIRA